jgi:hypothetical protein
LYRNVIEVFNAINPAFGLALQAAGQDQTQLNLAAWPPLRFVLEGANGAVVSLVVEPEHYWQFDSNRPGIATTGLFSGGAPYPGQSILGLPLFAGHYVVFDRTGGVVKFAAQRVPNPAPLVA